MGLLEKACATYDSQAERVGVLEDGKEMLSPIFHGIVKTQIEITITSDGKFVSARNEEINTLIPMTMSSATARTSTAPRPHPFSDKLNYLADYAGSRYDWYHDELSKWNNSKYTHAKVKAVLHYIEQKTILKDLSRDDIAIIELDDSGIPYKKYASLSVRWKVYDDKQFPEAWRDQSLIDSYISYYSEVLAEKGHDVCQISFEKDIVSEYHPSNIIPIASKGKLISSNKDEKWDFVFRGRFENSKQAACIGYISSQKAHNALRWIANNFGYSIFNRTFLWWKLNEREKTDVKLIKQDFIFGSNDKLEFANYYNELKDTINGFRNEFPYDTQIIVCEFAVPTTKNDGIRSCGRISLAYYNELGALDFAERLDLWYDDIIYNSQGYAPTIKQIVISALGHEIEDSKGIRLECKEALLAEMSSRLFKCIIENKSLPSEIVFSLVEKFSQPLNYKRYFDISSKKQIDNYDIVKKTAFSVVKKYRNRKFKEEWKLGLDRNETDRSYLFGRLLALYERIERETYTDEEKKSRRTNSERYRFKFVQCPKYGLRTLDEKTSYYKQKLRSSKYRLSCYFENEIVEVMDKLNTQGLITNERLDEKYILGYYHQLYAKSDKNSTETEIIDKTEEKEIEQ